MKKFLDQWRPAYFNAGIYLLFIWSLTQVSGTNWIFWLAFAWLASTVGNSIMLHRFYTHRVINMPRWLEYLLLPFTIILGIGSPITYAAIHRQHHRNCDDVTDPHSPHQLGKFAVYSGLWEFYPLSYFKNLKTPFPKDLVIQSHLLDIHNQYHSIWLLGFFLVSVFFGFTTAAFVFSWPAVYQKVLQNVVVNGICHPGPNGLLAVRDWPILGFITGGESMQGVHHARSNTVVYHDAWYVDPTGHLLDKLTRKNKNENQ